MKIVLVGAGGYGAVYLKYLLAHNHTSFDLEGIVEKFFDACAYKDQILAAGIPVYETLDAFYREHPADLTVISTPPFLHCEQSITALQHGSYVLCEKPAAPTAEEVQAMMDAEKKYGKFIAIGYQWSFSAAIQNLKKDLLNGEFGKPVTLKTFISWPRNHAYYARGGGWGGHVFTKDGRLLLDSIASNACAHYLHNMFFILGKDLHSSAYPVTAEAECFRVNPIDNFDTCILRMRMQDGTPLYYSATHAAKDISNPEFIYEFEKATVFFRQDEVSMIYAVRKDGTKKEYGDPFADNLQKLKECIRCVSAGETPICTAETAVQHTKIINSIYKNVSIAEFPQELRAQKEDYLYVKGLLEQMKSAYETMSLLSETGASYAKPASFSCDSYTITGK